MRWRPSTLPARPSLSARSSPKRRHPNQPAPTTGITVTLSRSLLQLFKTDHCQHRTGECRGILSCLLDSHARLHSAVDTAARRCHDVRKSTSVSHGKCEAGYGNGEADGDGCET